MSMIDDREDPGSLDPMARAFRNTSDYRTRSREED